MSPARRRVLLVGWDAADWKVIRPLLERGQMPHLARLVAGGASGNLATIYPPLSPMLWTSIATGKRPPKHGIHGFTEPWPDGSGVRPISILGRTTKAVWNILNQAGRRSVVVGWWPSHPAEPIDGVIVSDLFSRAGDGPEPLPLARGMVHPADWADRLAELRVTPMELPGEAIRLFVPGYEAVDQEADKRLHSLARIVAETMTVHAAATEALEHVDWDFAAVYYDGIDHFCHGFMAYHPPRPAWVPEADFAIYRDVVANAYRYHDAMLGRLLELAGPGATVIVMSDHGFHPDHLRPGYIPAEPAGPAVEHRHFGILCLHGPGIRRGVPLHGGTVLDIAPTVLHLFGLPVGADMDGKVLATALEAPGPVETVPSWDDVPGEAGLHPPEARVDPVAAAEAMRQLVALGYVAPPPDDTGEAVRAAVVELRYNLARAHDDADRPDLSAPIYEGMVAADPDEGRAVERLVAALLKLGRTARAAEVLDAFDARCAIRAPEAAAELKRREAARPWGQLEPMTVDADARDRFERRKLRELCGGFAARRALMRAWLDAAGERFDEARRGILELERLIEGTPAPPPARLLADLYASIGDRDAALRWAGRAVAHDPEDAHALAMSARLHLRARRYAAARDAAAGSLALVHFQPGIHYVLGRALLATGDPAGAERAFRVAMAQAPDMALAHEALARLLARQPGRGGDADLHRHRALEIRTAGRARREARPGAAEAAPGLAPADRVAFPDRRPGPDPGAGEGAPVTIVTGLPRSGTSMLMQMLDAGGLPVLTDGRRAADVDNPRGYLEFEPATRLRTDASWLPGARGKAVKLVLPLVPHLPPGFAYRLVAIARDLEEVLASQRRMLARLGRQERAARLSDDELARQYRDQERRVRDWLERRPEVAVLPLRYDRVVADPRGAAEALAAFLGPPFDVDAAATAVDPSLRRHRGDAGLAADPR